MSCLENDKIWDDILDRVDLDELTTSEREDFMIMDLEEAFAFAMRNHD